jgi:hypothetical protein
MAITFLFLGFTRNWWQIRASLIETRRLNYNLSKKKFQNFFRFQPIGGRKDPSHFQISLYCNFFFYATSGRKFLQIRTQLIERSRMVLNTWHIYKSYMLNYDKNICGTETSPFRLGTETAALKRRALKRRALKRRALKRRLWNGGTELAALNRPPPVFFLL